MAVPKVQLKDSLSLSQIIYGTWRLLDTPSTTEEMANRLFECVKMGISSFDLADIYGGGEHQSEKAFGEALKILFKEHPEIKRKDLQLITKCGIVCANTEYKHYNTSKEYILKRVEESLKVVGVEYFDLLLIHRPDPLMEAQEVAAAFQHLHQNQQVKYFGVSNFSNQQIQLLQSKMGNMPLLVNQIQFSPLHLEPLQDGSFEYLQQQEMGAMIWSPFAGGSIFNKTNQKLYSRLETLAQKYKTTIDVLVLWWLFRVPCKMSIILGTNQLKRIQSAVGVYDFMHQQKEVRMNRQEWFSILEAAVGKECP